LRQPSRNPGHVSRQCVVRISPSQGRLKISGKYCRGAAIKERDERRNA
jgi:hypothetical protein